MRIVLAGDHSSPELKAFIAAHLVAAGHQVDDLGTDSTQSTDYPLWGAAAAAKVVSGAAELGIIICGTGVGIGIAANKIHGIRCVICSEPFSAKMAREHNNANMLALGARVVGPELALMIVDTFIESSFVGGERHTRRVEEIIELDDGRELPLP
ncbi:MAG: ribose 5-phosphate isomerase B [Propionibacteriaceae bacterium]|jgi:ribose 5-phosphate isomerase B|nr:ribose 5-phosphate isomerase B [Propionibacteriaceae bacterium]